MLSKKAQTSMTVNEGLMIVRLLFIVFVSVSVVFLVFKFVALSVDIKNSEGNILINRLISSPGCLAYTDKTLGRSYPGIIDLSRFNPETLNNCIYFGESNDFAAASLNLTTIGTGAVYSAYYNEQGYKILYPKAGAQGSGGSMLFVEKRYVQIMDESGLKGGLLIVQLVLPNS
jgi:hypothetical protein